MAPGNPDPTTLSGISLFRGMPTRELERLAPLLHERNFPARASVLTAEQPGEAIYLIIEGSVKIHLLTPEGTEVILAVLGPGEIVGEMSLADSLGRSANVTTLEESAMLWMDRRTFRSGAESSTVLGGNLADVLSRRLRLANAHLLSLATLDVPGRVASQLLALAHEYGEEASDGVLIPITLIQADLAALVGASRVRVNQALGFFRKRNAISVDKDGRITVLDADVLARRAR
ncbi:MAG TPA: Crp/Fnr family transcriptional regulator [Rubrobacter sp.]|nr:Crp/Fnr family transcriptional regulator [Rubrobacter sp.]